MLTRYRGRDDLAAKAWEKFRTSGRQPVKRARKTMLFRSTGDSLQKAVDKKNAKGEKFWRTVFRAYAHILITRGSDDAYRWNVATMYADGSWKQPKAPAPKFPKRVMAETQKIAADYRLFGPASDVLRQAIDEKDEKAEKFWRTIFRALAYSILKRGGKLLIIW